MNMDVARFIAKRYLISKKSHNVINVISAISVIAIAFTTMAMVVVLSAFNGIESLIDGLYSKVESDVTIHPAQGKTIQTSYIDYDAVRNLEGVAHVSDVIEENVLIRHGENQVVGIVKGVEPEYVHLIGLDSMVFMGKPLLHEDGFDLGLLGLGIKYDLNLAFSESLYSMVRLYAPIRGKNIYQHKEDAFNKKHIQIRGIYSINIDIDNRYIFVPIDYAADLLGYQDEVSSIEVNLDGTVPAQRVKSNLEALLGDKMEIKTRAEKNALIYQTSKMEKWVTFIILTFILIIAAFNIVASLTMLIIDKKKDIFILGSMGANKSMIRKIFFFEGVLINLSGVIIGIGLGLLLVLVQSKIGLVPLYGGITPYYPVELKVSDLLIIMTVVVLVGLMSSYLPVSYLSRRLLKS
jgi:lipoprotein-releasing system permease protein